MSKRKQIVLGLIFVIASGVGVLFYFESQGPDAKTAYRWVFGKQPTDSITSLQTKYYSHSKGYGLYVAFCVPPSQLDQVFDTSQSRPLHQEETGYQESWRYEKTFREMCPEQPLDLKSSRISEWKKWGESMTIVFSPTSGQVFCFYLSDSDIQPRSFGMSRDRE